MQWTNRVGFVFTLFREFEMTYRNIEQNVGSVAITLSKKRTTIYPSPIYYVVTSHRVFLFWITPIWGVIKKRYGYFPFYDLYNQDDFCKNCIS